MSKTRSAFSWFVSLSIHGAILFFLLHAGYRYAFPEGEVTTGSVNFDTFVQESKGFTPQQQPAQKKPAPQPKPQPQAKAKSEPVPAPAPVAQEEEAQELAQASEEPADNQGQGDEAVDEGTNEDAAAEGEGEEGPPPPFGTPGSMADESKMQEAGNNRPPSYPEIANIRGWEGTVTVYAYIKKDGSVDLPIVGESSGYPVLDRSAVDAYREWKYLPPGKAGWVRKDFIFKRPK